MRISEGVISLSKTNANKLQAPSREMTDLLKRTGSQDRAVASAAMRALAAALDEPLRQGVLAGDIIGNIFAVENLEPGSQAEYPLDFYQPGMEGQFVAYTLPSEGAVPQRTISGDTVTVQTYDLGNAIDWPLKYSREARWNVVARAMEVLEAGFVKKMNTDAWRVLIAAAYGRGFTVVDSAANAGQFTKRLVSLMKTTMRRKLGGNTGSANRGRMTDLYLSPEAMEDIREWSWSATGGGTSVIDPVTMRDIFTNEDGALSRIYGVNLHDLDELGEDQEFTNFYTDEPEHGGLGGTFANSDVEIVVGLDLSKNDSFVMPVKEPLTVFDDPTLHRRRRAGVYAWLEAGFACLDPRRTLLGAF